MLKVRLVLFQRYNRKSDKMKFEAKGDVIVEATQDYQVRVDDACVMVSTHV